MTDDVYDRFDDQPGEPAERAASAVIEKKIRHLPVVNRRMRSAGILSRGGLRQEGESGAACGALGRFSAAP